MHRGIVRVGIAIATAVGVSMVAACSGSGSAAPPAGKAATAVLPQITAAVRSASSVHMTGTVTSGSQTITLSISFAGSGGMAGTMTVNGANLGVLATNGQTYVKINPSFLALAKAPASACKQICGKYVQVPAADAQSITGALSMSGLIDGVFGKLPHAVSGQYFVPGTYQGQSVLEFRQHGYTLIVAGHGKPYPLAITAPHGEYLDFSDWNAVTPPAPPPASQTVKIGALG